MTTASVRGHKVYWTGTEWLDQDSFIRNGKTIPCSHCGREPIPFESDTGDDVDACIGIIPGVISACCGHGYTCDAYVWLESGEELRGQEALDWFEEYKKSQLPQLRKNRE